MKMVNLTAAVLTAVALASCGGGGPVAGDAAEMSLSPPGMTMKVGDCARSGGADTVVTINGGQPPFRIVNSSPQWMTVDRTQVTGKDPTFRVTTLAGCGEDMTVTVLDYHSQLAVFTVTVETEE
ncbi:MAG: hypothetical protein R3E99_04930 [Burkholderiaceae bacterium]